MPCKITLIRSAARKLDSDNLCGALKFVRDSVAELILPHLPKGRADGDPRIEWLYGQQSGEDGVIIQIESKDER